MKAKFIKDTPMLDKGTIGKIVNRPYWYEGITGWDYYVEIEPYVVVGVMSDEIELMEEVSDQPTH